MSSIDRIQAFLWSSYALAFFFGAGVIAFFAYRQLESYSATFPKEHSVVLKLASASLLGGQRLFRKAYLYYLLVLELFYVIICTFEPIVSVIFPPAAGEERPMFGSEEWPLAASLLIVGFGPNFPIAVQIEQFFRRFSQRIAGIPEHLFEIIDRLQQFDLNELRSGDERLEEFFDQAANAERAALRLGMSRSQADDFRTSILSILLFQYFTLSRFSEAVWSEVLRSRFSDLLEFLGPRADAFNNDLEAFNATIGASDFMRRFEYDATEKEGEPPPDYRAALQAFLTAAGGDQAALEQNRSALLTRLAKVSKDAASLANQLQALVALYLVNERAAADETKPIAILQTFALDTRRHFVWNALGTGLLLAFGTTFLARAVYGVVLCSSFCSDLAKLGPKVIQDSLNMAFAFLVTCGVAAVVAVFMRSSKKEARTWVPFSIHLNKYPIGQYFGILLLASFIAGAMNVTNFLVHQYLTSVDSATVVNDFLRYTLPPRMAYSVSSGLFGCALCLVLDRWDLRTLRPRTILAFSALSGLVIAAFGGVVLLRFGRTDILGSEVLGLFTFTVTATATFLLLLFKADRAKVTRLP